MVRSLGCEAGHSVPLGADPGLLCPSASHFPSLSWLFQSSEVGGLKGPGLLPSRRFSPSNSVLGSFPNPQEAYMRVSFTGKLLQSRRFEPLAGLEPFRIHLQPEGVWKDQLISVTAGTEICLGRELCSHCIPLLLFK